MTNKQKIKGTEFENQVVDMLNKSIRNAHFKRIAASGSLGTVMGEPLLTGDVKGEVDGFYKRFKGECKAGYNSSREVKQFTLKKEWLDKIKAEAYAINSVPLLFGKFMNVRTGVKYFVVLDINDFIELMNEYVELKEDFDKVFVSLQEEREKRG